MSELRERFERDGFLFPIRIFSEVEAERYGALYAGFEGQGQIKDDSPGLKIHCVFRWAYEIATNPAVLDVVEELIGPNILVFGSRPWNKLRTTSLRRVAPGQLVLRARPARRGRAVGRDDAEHARERLHALRPGQPSLGRPGPRRSSGIPMNRLTRGQEITTIDEAASARRVLAPARRRSTTSAPSTVRKGNDERYAPPRLSGELHPDARQARRSGGAARCSSAASTSTTTGTKTRFRASTSTRRDRGQRTRDRRLLREPRTGCEGTLAQLKRFRNCSHKPT